MVKETLSDADEDDWQRRAAEALTRCDALARCTDEPGLVSRVFCSEAMKDAHSLVGGWMAAAGMSTRVDAAANLRGLYYPPGADPARRVVIASHIDTVIDAGRYDGVLGVLLGIETVGRLREEDHPLPWAIEVIAFSDEEGVRFRLPFLGSRALAGTLDRDSLELRDNDGVAMREALGRFGVDPSGIPECAEQPGAIVAYLEPHIEQGPRLEHLDAPLAVVTAIAGQTRLSVEWVGEGGHAGTTPMGQRRDPLVAACRWAVAVNALGVETPGLVATVGKFEVEPNASNCIPRRVRTSLDVRHEEDRVRTEAIERLADLARQLADEGSIRVQVCYDHEHAAIAMDSELATELAAAIEDMGFTPHRLVSGAGHDAGVIATIAPTTLLFLRSPGGVSHDPQEAVTQTDAAAALRAMYNFVLRLAAR